MEDFVPFEIAKKLKEKGFNYPCIGHYVNNQLYVTHYQNAFHSDNDESVDFPTISQVLKWLREKNNIHLYTDIDNEGWFFEIKCLKTGFMVNTNFLKRYSTYELAALAGVEYVIDNLI